MKRWRLPEGSIMLGDCQKHMRLMKANSVDLVFGSPPYESQRTYEEDGINYEIARNTEEWVEWMVDIYWAASRICKGLVAFVVGHGVGGRTWSGGPALLAADPIRLGFNLRSPAWYYRKGIMGSGGKDWLAADMEWIICAAPPGRLPWADNLACGTPPKFNPGGQISNRTKAGKRTNEGKEWYPLVVKCMEENNMTYPQAITHLGFEGKVGWHRGKKGKILKNYIQPEKCNPGNVIKCIVGGGRMGSNITHENVAGFPDKLPNFFIRSFCPPGGVVYDPFGGSGTTLAEAIKLDRRFLASDLRPSQIDLMLRRAKQARLNKGAGFHD